jgi:hypothetical protein
MSEFSYTELMALYDGLLALSVRGDVSVTNDGDTVRVFDLRQKVYDTAQGECESTVAAIELAEADAWCEFWKREALRKYPTPEAYAAVCHAMETHRVRATLAERRISSLRDSLVEMFTVAVSAAVTIREAPEDAQDMVEFLLSAVDRNDAAVEVIMKEAA